MLIAGFKNTVAAQSNSFSQGILNKKVDFFSFFALLILVIVLLIPRLGGLDILSGKYLWAEDGTIFINEAQFIGFASLWKPYAGYLHVYPRLVAIIANYFSLDIRPIIYFIGWMLSYLFLFWILNKKAKIFETSFLSLVFLFILVSFQRYNSQNLFNISYSQWMLGAALSLLVLTKDPSFKSSALNIILLFLLGLTGPFSLILIPILILKSFIIKDFRKNIWMYLVVIGSGIVQLCILLHSERLGSKTIDPHIWDWLTSFIQIVLFGANTVLTKICALFFYVILMITMFSKTNLTLKQSEIKIQVALNMMGAVLFIFAAQWACKENPMAVALDDATRYVWIPQTLIFFSAIIISNNNLLTQIALFTVAFIICFQQFHPVTFQNLQFKSFANFANYTNITIPISPQWAEFPGWHINGVPRNNVPAEQVNIKFSTISVAGAKTNLLKNKFEIISISNDPMLTFNNKIICKKASDVGLEFNIWRSHEGWMQVFWDNNGMFSEQKSLRRWYPSGLVKAQFALPYAHGGVNIRFDPLEMPGEIKVNNIKVYCLS
ncbi:hypothetical protein Lgra_0752 [Legionella gratiana]|uniref:Transmembrane protein n=1 Tax=Legionella gratiana TaxID=45066 RepID=A0A378JEK3_9GAMM|nr:hypothetical protein [Legionella gratiana]KTD14142.1 hypothetical protein Lgra_0752 [Legionella gratiana]STX46273.1 Uncharacterised protein [Legionella gratiana]